MTMINLLPPELLAHIFIEGFRVEQKERRDLYSPTQHLPEFRDFITWVCRTWRLVALSTPQLWSYIGVSDRHSWKRSSLYLSRTDQNQPLDVYFDFTRRFLLQIPGGGESLWSDILMGILRSIIEYGGNPDRWRTFNIRVRRPDMVPPDFMEYVSSLPLARLESFSLMSYHDLRLSLSGINFSALENEMHQSDNPTFALRSSKLCSVHFRSFSLRYLVENLGVSAFSNLTCLELGLLDACPSFVQLGCVFRQNPNLRVCRISLGDLRALTAGVSYAPPGPGEPILLPCLQELSLKNCSLASWVEILLSNVVAPAVTKFRLTINRDHRGGWEKVATPITHSRDGRPLFQSLDHLATNLPTDVLAVLLRTYQDLDRLDLVYGHGRESESLALLGRTPWLVPRLRYLWADGCYPGDTWKVGRARREAGFTISVIKGDRMNYAAYFT